MLPIIRITSSQNCFPVSSDMSWCKELLGSHSDTCSVGPRSPGPMLQAGAQKLGRERRKERQGRELLWTAICFPYKAYPMIGFMLTLSQGMLHEEAHILWGVPLGVFFFGLPLYKNIFTHLVSSPWVSCIGPWGVKRGKGLLLLNCTSHHE